MTKRINHDYGEGDRAFEVNRIKYRAHLATLLTASNSFDKGVLGLSTASLGFTFAFIKTIPHAHCICLLILTWVLLVLSIISISVAFIIYQIHSTERMKEMHKSIINNSALDDKPDWTDFWMTWLPPIAGLCLVFSISLFTIFVGQNID